ncbi:MAG TPA: threonine synthase [Cyclobacteriaceae bacterium]|jgi:threonine synthase|nr:threonine synthase [Cyclobacteriaceae bacterium]
MLVKENISRISHLQCPVCKRPFPFDQINTYAQCENCQRNPLLTFYDLTGLSKDDIDFRERSMWRYAKFLPVLEKKNIVSLGEGWTPILNLSRQAELLDVAHLLMKDESPNPTGSFKARGLSAAVSKAKELGIKEAIVPTAGNAGGAMAAYCARAGMKATVVMPSHTPKSFQMECEFFGAELILVDGLISDCAKRVAELNNERQYFDFSTMKEPYRLEGKKTMGYEIAEQMNWKLPDVILYPTGGGTGLIGMWKAFLEMIEMGWIQNKLPRLIAVQSDQCRPVVETFLEGKISSPLRQTIANGLAVPTPFAQAMIQRVLCETNGNAISVSEEEIVRGVQEMAITEGMLIAPEGGALLPALKKLLQEEIVKRDETILLLNTGSGYKYFENLG